MIKPEMKDKSTVNVYLKPEQLAEKLQIGRDKAYKLCALEGFPAIKLNNSFRIHPIKLELWLDENLGNIINL